MNHKTRIGVAIAATLVLASTATAGALHFNNNGVLPGALNGVHDPVNSKGFLRPNAVGHLQIKNHSISCEKLSWPLVNQLCRGVKGDAGATGAAGPVGPAGPQGDAKTGAPGADGAPGAAGVKGDAGMPGLTGPQGPAGPQGTPGANGLDAPAAEYGVATINVSRGDAAATTWATYSTRLGSPVGDQAGGVFRFTCSTAKAPCTIALKAGVTSPNAGSVSVYPRILVYRQDYDAGGPSSYCEYADGSTGAAPASVTKAPSVSLASLTINIGGSADCGGPVATAGDVSVITVPSGYYDVHSTTVFLP